MSTQPPVEAEVMPPSNALAVKSPQGNLEKVTPSSAPVTEQPITPAQAKVNAIAELTMSAYQRAAMLDLTDQEAEALQADFPDEAFKPGAGGKEHLIYIEHAFLRDRFNAVFGMGKWAIVPRNRWAESFRTSKGTPGERVYVEAMLIVRGCFVGEAVGAMEYYPNNESQNYGDAVEGAKTAAFRRCAKEFGVGLQAWKKDWCDGWWARKRQKPTTGPTRSPSPAPSRPAPRPPAAPAAPTGQNSPTPSPGPSQTSPVTPTAKTKEWFLNEFRPYGDIARDFFRELGVLSPTEELEDYPIERCPTSRQTVEELKKQVAEFAKMQGGDATQGDPPCFATIVPIPRKGMTRADYLTNPDTIGSLYHAAKNGDDDARRRLWGFVSHYEPKGWKKKDGTPMPPNKSDVEFRDALDAFQAWHDANHPKDNQ